MYLRAQAIVGMTVLDRELHKAGHVYDLYFDDISFAVRYLVVETGSLFSRQIILIPPDAISFISVERDEVGINMPSGEFGRSDMSRGIPDIRRRAKPHLRSFQAVHGYPLHSQTQCWGYLDDLIIRSMTWVVRFLSVEHHRHYNFRKAIIDTKWISGVDWHEHVIFVDLPVDQMTPSDVSYQPQLRSNQ